MTEKNPQEPEAFEAPALHDLDDENPDELVGEEVEADFDDEEEDE